MNEPSVRDALIAEMLGDIGKLHDSVETLKTTLANQAEQTQKQAAQTVEFLRSAGEDFKKNIRLANSVVDSSPSYFELFKNIHEQWAIDARSIGESMNAAQEKIDASLAKLSLQENKNSPLLLNPNSVPVIKRQIAQKTPLGFWVTFALSALVTSACFVGVYYFSGMDKSTRLGESLTRNWMELDLPTRTKITNALKSH